MAAVQDYLSTLPEPARSAFTRLRDLALEVVPDAEEATSYGLPALTYRRKPLIGFQAAQQHLSVYPFSSQVLDTVRARLAGFATSKGTIRFTADRPLPDDVVRDLVRLRLAEITG